MKRILCTLALLSAIPAGAAGDDIPGQTRLWTEAQALTRAAPTLITEGMALKSIKGYRLAICAASGQTLSGSGTLQAYLWDTDLAVWMRNPELDKSVTSTIRCQTFPDIQTITNSGRVLYAATSVTVSSGTVTTRIKAAVQVVPQ